MRRLSCWLVFIVACWLSNVAHAGFYTSCEWVRGGDVSTPNATNSTPGYWYCTMESDGIITPDGTDGGIYEGGGGGLGTSDFSLPTPPPIACTDFAGKEEREAAITALYKTQLQLQNMGLPGPMLSQDMSDMGKEWMILFVRPGGAEGAWTAAIYTKTAPYQSSLAFQETMSPQCEN